MSVVSLKYFACQGCAALRLGLYPPTHWIRYGVSALGGPAYWCAACDQDGIRHAHAQSTKHRAEQSAKKRGVYDTLVTLNEMHSLERG